MKSEKMKRAWVNFIATAIFGISIVILTALIAFDPLGVNRENKEIIFGLACLCVFAIISTAFASFLESKVRKDGVNK